MNNSIAKLADKLGLTVEVVPIDDHEPAVRVYKGARLIFIGTDAAATSFLEDYEKNRVPAFPNSPLIPE